MLRSGGAVLLMLLMAGQAVNGQEVGAEKYHDLPHVGVSLLMPQGFEAAEGFDGILNRKTSVSMMAVKAPVGFDAFSKPYQTGASLPQNVKIKSRIPHDVGMMKGCLVEATQNAGLIDVRKWLLIFGDDAKSYVIMANAPGDPDDATVAAMKEMLLKTKLLQGGGAATNDDMPFEVSSDDFKISRGPLKMLYLTKDGVLPIKSPTDPLMIVGKATSDIFNRNPIEFLSDRIKKDANQGAWEQSKPRPIKVADLEGCIVEVRGKNKSGDSLRGFWAVLMNKETYYLFMGTCGEKDAGTMRAEFNKVVESFKVKPPPAQKSQD